MLSRRSGKGGFYFSPFFFYMPASRANLPKRTPSQQYLQVVFQKTMPKTPKPKALLEIPIYPREYLPSIHHPSPPRSPEMLGRHPRAVKAPVGYFNKSSRNRATKTKVPGPGAQPTAASALDTEAETSPSVPAAGPSTRASAPTFPFRMTPDPPGMIPETAFVTPPILTSKQAADAADLSRHVPEVPWMYGPFSISDTTWFASSEYVGERSARKKEVAPKSSKPTGDKHSHLLPIKGVFYLMAL